MKKTLGIIGIFILTSSFSQPKTEEVKEVFAIIDSYPFKYKDLIKRQFLLESSHAKSEVYKANNNAFGMRLPKSRRTNALASKKGYATYRNVRSSIVDRYHYEMRYMKGLSRIEYLRFLNKIYSSGSGKYTRTLKKINIKRYE